MSGLKPIVLSPAILEKKSNYNCHFTQAPDAQSYLRNNKSSEVKRLRCFPQCTDAGHKAQGFCGNVVRAQLTSPVFYTDEDIKNGKFVVLGELCEVNQHGHIVGSIFDKNPINSHTFEKYTDWYSSSFCLFPGLVQGVRGQATSSSSKPYSYTVEFNPSSWPYSWKGSRHKSPKHAFVCHVLGRKGVVNIVPPVQAMGARTADGVHHLEIEPTNPLVPFEHLVKLRSRIFEINCCRRAGGPMMLTKWADAVRAKQTVPFAATKNLARNELLSSKGTPKKGTKKLLKNRAAERRKVKRTLSEETRKQVAMETAAATDVLSSLSFSASKSHPSPAYSGSLMSPGGSVLDIDIGNSPFSAPRHSAQRSGTRAHTFQVSHSSSASSASALGTPCAPLLAQLSVVEQEATAALSFLSPAADAAAATVEVKKDDFNSSTGSTMGHLITGAHSAEATGTRDDDARLLFDMSTNSAAKAKSSSTSLSCSSSSSCSRSNSNNNSNSSSSSSSEGGADQAVNLRTVLEQEPDESGRHSKRPRLDAL